MDLPPRGSGQTTVGGLTPWDRRLAFVVDDGTALSLYVTDGVDVRRLGDSNPYSWNLAVHGGSLIFGGASPDTGHEPWAVDPISLTPAILADLAPGPASSGRPGPRFARQWR